MGWRQCVTCVECGDEVDLPDGDMPPGPCEEGGGACNLVVSRVWDEPNSEPQQAAPGAGLWGAPPATTGGAGAGGGQDPAGLFAGRPRRGAQRS